MSLKLIFLASWVGVSLCRTIPRAIPHCVDSIVQVSASATNFDLSSGVLPDNATLQVIGTFGIQLRYCEPTIHMHSREDTLQILVHGATYNTDYWDVGFEPDTYSYVRFAAAHGYATLNMARLGNGESDRPDPVSVVQTPFVTAMLQALIKDARSGRIPGLKRPFNTIIYAGHSLGSILLNNILLTHPELVDAAIFTGYAHDLTGFAPIGGIVGLGAARDIDPARFGSLAPDYTATVNATGRAAAFYGPQGSFDPAALAHDEAHKDTTTTGEALTLPVPVVAAPLFKGDVFAVNGGDDLVFCLKPKCANTAEEAQFYPAAKSFESAVIPRTGHSINYHYSAPLFFATLQGWLTRHGY